MPQSVRPRTMSDELTAKQQRFVDEFLVDLNASQAAIRAGYSRKTAAQIGHENLKKPEVAAAIASRQQALQAKLEVTQERVIAELAKIGFANMADYMRAGPGGDPYLDFSALTRDQAAALQEVTTDTYVEGGGEEAREVKRVKFKLADKRAALVELGRHLGLFKGEAGGKVMVTLEQLIAGSMKVEVELK